VSGARHLYVHLPFCSSRCGYCDFVTAVGRRGDHSSYVDALLAELALERELLAPELETVFLGGGTPTYFASERLERLVGRLRERFRFAADAEVGVEVDPRVTTAEHLASLAKNGFNRLSMGVQDFDPVVQEAINRIQPYADTRRLVEQARALGFPSVNMDLIFGLPHQTPETFAATPNVPANKSAAAAPSFANLPAIGKF